MAYRNVISRIVSDSSHAWQFRISIHPNAVTEGHPGNRIEEIKRILSTVFADAEVDIKIGIIYAEELNTTYDGAMSNCGTDRDQRGKEICVYVPNSDQQQLSTDQYKQLMLKAWAALQVADIPLLYIDIPGDRKITGPGNLPTPFSYTSSTAAREWLRPHGILFKQFEGYDQQHPLLAVQMSQHDLEAAGIDFSAHKHIAASRRYIALHQDEATQRIAAKIESLGKSSYAELLNNDAISQRIKLRIEAYRQQFDAAAPNEKGRLQTAFSTEMAQDLDFQALVNHYPRANDSNFSKHSAIDCIERVHQLTSEEFQEKVQELRTGYNAEVERIKTDFFMSDAELEAQGRIKVNWAIYFGDQDIAELIRRNPQQMQVLYRNIIFLEMEDRAYQTRNTQVDDALISGLATDLTMTPIRKAAQAIQQWNKEQAKPTAFAFLHRAPAIPSSRWEERFNAPETTRDQHFADLYQLLAPKQADESLQMAVANAIVKARDNEYTLSEMVANKLITVVKALEMARDFVRATWFKLQVDVACSQINLANLQDFLQPRHVVHLNNPQEKISDFEVLLYRGDTENCYQVLARMPAQEVASIAQHGVLPANNDKLTRFELAAVPNVNLNSMNLAQLSMNLAQLRLNVNRETVFQQMLQYLDEKRAKEGPTSVAYQQRLTNYAAILDEIKTELQTEGKDDVDKYQGFTNILQKYAQDKVTLSAWFGTSKERYYKLRDQLQTIHGDSFQFRFQEHLGVIAARGTPAAEDLFAKLNPAAALTSVASHIETLQ